MSAEEKKKGTVPGKTQRSVYIPDELLARFKDRAAQLRYNVNTLIIIAMEQYLDGAPPQQISSRRSDDVIDFDD